VGQLMRDAVASFREGLRHKKIDRRFSDAVQLHLDSQGATDSGRYHDRVRQLCDEATSIGVDAHKVGLARARSFVIWTLRNTHPELTETALRALGDYCASRWHGIAKPSDDINDGSPDSSEESMW
jgi:hypothetical protein